MVDFSKNTAEFGFKKGKKRRNMKKITLKNKNTMLK
jgi:hypothetical protein